MAAMRAKKPALKTVLGQPSWRLASPRVEAYVTQTGGMIGPVTFDRTGKKIRPLSVAPWATEAIDKSNPEIIRALRGDFFCMPFGGNARRTAASATRCTENPRMRSGNSNRSRVSGASGRRFMPA
jgi:hypothetical protein